MKLLLLNTPNQGLLAQFYHEVMSMLVAEGHEVVCFAFKKQEEAYLKDGVQYLVYTQKNILNRYADIFKVMRQQKPDIVISNHSYINPALICGKLLGVGKNIAWFHSAYGHSKRIWWHVWFKKYCFKLADTVIANSEFLSNDIQKYYSVRRSQIQPLPFWTSIAERGEEALLSLNANNGFKVGCPARLVKDKNISVVLKAFKQLQFKTPHATLYIAGSGEYQSDLEAEVKHLQLENTVIFLGNLSAEQMKHFYKNMDVIVLPSLHEAFGLVFIEAIAMDCPILVSSSFGALGFIDTKTYDMAPFVFDPLSVEQLATKMAQFAKYGKLSDLCFKELYLHTFNKALIYKKLKCILFE